VTFSDNIGDFSDLIHSFIANKGVIFAADALQTYRELQVTGQIQFLKSVLKRQ
jgi:hypothetical protein